MPAASYRKAAVTFDLYQQYLPFVGGLCKSEAGRACAVGKTGRA